MASKQQVEALLDKGLTVREIADRIGAMREYVSTTLHRNGWLHRVKRRAPYPNLRALNAELLAALKEARDYVRGDLKNLGPCEHDVGHCVCGIRSMLHNMEEAIAKAETKP